MALLPRIQEELSQISVILKYLILEDTEHSGSNPAKHLFIHLLNFSGTTQMIKVKHILKCFP